MKESQARARQGKGGRENAVDTAVHEAFEVALDAVSRRMSLFSTLLAFIPFDAGSGQAGPAVVVTVDVDVLAVLVREACHRARFGGVVVEAAVLARCRECAAGTARAAADRTYAVLFEFASLTEIPDPQSERVGETFSR